MPVRHLASPGLAALAALGLLAQPAAAQGMKSPNPFNDQGPAPQIQTYQGPQGFSFQGDELPPSHDRRVPDRNDNRYSQTRQQQQAEAEKPGGGCLRYGAAGALGGHLAGHGFLGAVAGCAVGSIVRRRDSARIEQQTNR